jgi:hypothetical protein
MKCSRLAFLIVQKMGSRCEHRRRRMKYKFWNPITISLIITVIITLYAIPAQCSSHEEIFKWVAKQLEISKDYSMPEIKMVSKKELRKIFSKSSEKSLKRWAQDFGEEEADKMMNRYLKQVIGLYIPETKAIYVGRFLDECKRKSILAHELTHYFQDMTEGKIDPQSFDADLMYLRNELEASRIEKKFLKTFCGLH